MKKILLLVLLLPVVASAADDKVLETWRCYDTSDYNHKKVLVTLTRRLTAYEGEELETGVVAVAGTEYPAMFELQGFNRRWSFGEDLKYVVVMEPDGTARYYDFTRAADGETVMNTQIYDCKQKS